MKETDKILEDEYGKISGELGLMPWGLMPKNVFEASFDLDMSPDVALTEVGAAAGHLGRVIGRKTSDGGTHLAAVIGAGFLRMMPAVVDIYITPLGNERSRVKITGTARETLIKQRAGEGAVRRLVAAMHFGSVSTAN